MKKNIDSVFIFVELTAKGIKVYKVEEDRIDKKRRRTGRMGRS